MEKVNIVKIKTQYSIAHTQTCMGVPKQTKTLEYQSVFILEKILFKLNKVKVS